MIVGSTAFAGGGIDVDQYCKEQFGGDASAYPAIDNAYGWRCELGDGTLTTVDMQAACQSQQGLPYARYGDFNDSYSWYCTN